DLDEKKLLGTLDKNALVKKLQETYGIKNPEGQIELLHRLQMAAEAEFNYKYKRHYTVLYGKTAADNKIVIINPHTHAGMRDPETGSERRWFGGVAQALEAKHGLIVRADSDDSTTTKITNEELFKDEAFGQVTGASGTALGHEQYFAAHGMSANVV